MIIQNKTKEYTEYIPTDCILYIFVKDNEYVVNAIGGIGLSISRDNFDKKILDEFVNCGNGYYLNKKYIVSINLNKEKKNGSVSIFKSKEIDVADISILSGIVDDFVTIYSNDRQQCFAINPTHIINVINPTVTQTINVSMPGGTTKFNIDAIASLIVFAKVRLSIGSVYEYAGNDALQVLKYYEDLLAPLVVESESDSTNKKESTKTEKKSK